MKKTEGLRASLTQIRATRTSGEAIYPDLDTVERTEVGRWLGQEFSEDPPEDANLPPFTASHP